MRALSYILIALGFYLAVAAGYDEFRGRTTYPMMVSAWRNSNSRYLYSRPVFRQYNPKLFRQFMVTHWIYASLAGTAGCIVFLVYMNQKRSGP